MKTKDNVEMKRGMAVRWKRELSPDSAGNPKYEGHYTTGRVLCCCRDDLVEIQQDGNGLRSLVEPDRVEADTCE